jgi:hypothetical protein
MPDEYAGNRRCRVDMLMEGTTYPCSHTCEQAGGVLETQEFTVTFAKHHVAEAGQ